MRYRSLAKNRKFGKKIKKFRQKSKILSKIKNFVKNQKNVVKNRKFRPKSKISSKN